LGGLQRDKSFIEGVQSFPINVELQTVSTFQKEDATVTYVINSSIVSLPEQEMPSRLYDERVGYFSRGFRNFDAPEGVDIISIITRWRLEPKEEDQERYLKGELVEPKKPIVYYIDPATPQKWVPYLMQGVNDWQKAFEKAGFKNAIYALEAPVGDSTFSLFDARHNAIVYKPSIVPNASGPHVHDPRTGEILETHINWYHNVQQLLHDWYLVQTGPNDSQARKVVFDDALMGELIRFVSTHEVGHTLGLRHNFGASSTVPVDSLRSKSYIEKNGICPSIMDYARFNYVAQPEDHLTRQELMPRIGMYDEWAIEWGYRWLPQLTTRAKEKAYMNQWIITQLKKDKRYWYGEQPPSFADDPRRQSEDLGDNAMKAGEYGIKNLKRVMANVMEWSKEPNEDYSYLAQINNAVLGQYYTYIMHVTTNIAFYTWTRRKQGEDGSIVGYTPKEKQREAVRFLQKYLFDTPDWLVRKDVFSLIGGYGPYTPSIIQQRVIDWLLLFDAFERMEYVQQMLSPKGAYTFDELLIDLEAGIWKELRTTKSIDFARQRLQKIYAEQLIKMATLRPNDPFVDLKIRSQYIITAQAHLKIILKNIERAFPAYKDANSKLHLQFIRDRIRKALYQNAPEEMIISNAIPKVPQPKGFHEGEMKTITEPDANNDDRKINNWIGCWEIKKWLNH
jgi:hypothetical protein